MIAEKMFAVVLDLRPSEVSRGRVTRRQMSEWEATTKSNTISKHNRTASEYLFVTYLEGADVDLESDAADAQWGPFNVLTAAVGTVRQASAAIKVWLQQWQLPRPRRQRVGPEPDAAASAGAVGDLQDPVRDAAEALVDTMLGFCSDSDDGSDDAGVCDELPALTAEQIEQMEMEEAAILLGDYDSSDDSNDDSDDAGYMCNT